MKDTMDQTQSDAPTPQTLAAPAPTILPGLLLAMGTANLALGVTLSNAAVADALGLQASSTIMLAPAGLFMITLSFWDYVDAIVRKHTVHPGFNAALLALTLTLLYVVSAEGGALIRQGFQNIAN